MAEREQRKRIKAALRRYLPDGKYGPRVHRDLVADAFEAGMRAATAIDIPTETVADAFEVYCDEELTE